MDSPLRICHPASESLNSALAPSKQPKRQITVAKAQTIARSGASHALTRDDWFATAKRAVAVPVESSTLDRCAAPGPLLMIWNVGNRFSGKCFLRLSGDCAQTSNDALVDTQDGASQLAHRGNQCESDSSNDQGVLYKILSLFVTEKINGQTFHGSTLRFNFVGLQV